MDEFDNVVRHLGIGAAFDVLGQSWGGMLMARYAATRAPAACLARSSAPPSRPHRAESRPTPRATCSWRTRWARSILEAGKAADLVVVSADLTALGARLAQVKVLQTWFDGRRVWSA